MSTSPAVSAGDLSIVSEHLEHRLDTRFARILAEDTLTEGFRDTNTGFKDYYDADLRRCRG